MFLIITFFLVILFLIFNFCLTALGSSLRRLNKQESQKQLEAAGSLFFYRYLHLSFFPKQEFEGIFFVTLFAQNVARFVYALSSFLFLSHTALFEPAEQIPGIYDFSWFWIALSILGFLLLGFLIGDFLPRMLGTRHPSNAIRLCAPLAALLMTLIFPLAAIFLKLAQILSHTMYFDYFQEPTAQAKREIIEIIQNAKLSPEISRHDKQLIEAVLSFKERIAREVMVPRINLFCLPHNTTIREAARLLHEEGYSRTPVYKNSIDNIVGTLMYKELLSKYMEYAHQGHNETILDATIETLAKPPLYTPETKKLSNLLQEFRKKQVHLAIVVDEYGGTEGVVTIEDILEEIVGDIADEYDELEEPFKPLPDQSWIVDAKTSILDAEEQLGIIIPQEADYDTIGGYLYHRAGTIPTKGFTIHHDSFELEVLSSNDRAVEKVRIRPLYPDEQ